MEKIRSITILVPVKKTLVAVWLLQTIRLWKLKITVKDEVKRKKVTFSILKIFYIVKLCKVWLVYFRITMKLYGQLFSIQQVSTLI
jgi:hypothetical protein